MEILKVNGIEKQFPEGEIPSTISDLLKSLNVNEATVVAEVDGEIVERKNFSKHILSSGQSVELVRFVGGG